MPLDARLAKHLAECKAMVARRHLAHEAKGDESLHEPVQVAVALDQAPVEPTDGIVLAVGVVITTLRAPYLVAHQDHGRAIRQQIEDKKILA